MDRRSKRLAEGIIGFGLFIAAGLSALADEVGVDFPGSPAFPVFGWKAPVKLSFRVQRDNPGKSETLEWALRDYLGAVVCRGKLDVPAGEKDARIPLEIADIPAGYMQVEATLEGSKVALPRRGSRPEGMATFGVTGPIGWLPLAHPDDSRFGIQGTNFIKSGIFLHGDPYDPLYKTLGVRWVNTKGDWADAEPDHPGQYAESPYPAEGKSEADYIPQDLLAPLTCVATLPWWALAPPEGTKLNEKDWTQKMSYPAKDDRQYAAYLKLLASRQAESRKARYPELRRNYYQIGWEPDWHWKGTPEQFVDLYSTAARAIREGDPEAVVLAPGYGVTLKGVELLEALLPMGLGDAIDGIAIHGYYVPFGNPKATTVEGKYVSPEDGKTVEAFRKLRRLMNKYLKPGAKLFQTEWGLDYRGRYADVTPELLRKQAAYVTRGHLIFLGEGCDVTYFFYTADYGSLEKGGEDGYGLCFNLTMPRPSFGATKVSPKPVFMAGCNLTRILEGSKTIGPVDLGEGVRAYAFRRGDENVLAIWSGDDVARSVKVPGWSDSVREIDIMGNVKQPRRSDSDILVESSQYPIYLLGVGEVALSPQTANL